MTDPRTLELAGICPYCGHDIPEAAFPWLFQRHTVHGAPTGAGTLCPGSRNIYTLDILGLRDIEDEHVPERKAA